MITVDLTKKNRISLRAKGFELLQQTLKFGLVGVMNTAIDWSVYFLLVSSSLPISLNPVIAKVIAYLSGSVNSSFINHRWTFRSQKEIQKIVLPFLLVNIFGTMLNAATHYVATVILDIEEPSGLIFATLVAFIWNFAISKFVIFRTSSQKDPEWQESYA
jgi:putative flippase GtrA